MSFNDVSYASCSVPNSDIALSDSRFRSTRRSKLRFFLAAAAMTMLACGASRVFANSISVNYTATNVGGTEWRYDYTLSGSYLSGDDVAVYFPVASSANLSDLGSGGTDWTTFVFQPDPTLPAAGEFDMLANIDNPTLAPVFSVLFQWSGSGSPGSQSFTLFDPSFKVLDTGVTQANAAQTSEPSSLVLLGSGFLVLWLAARRRPLFALE
jgi:hypothetical protein